VYFCVDYPIAPQADVRKMRAYCLKALTWLRTTVGAKSVIVGGDSAGGNLALHVLSDMPQSSSQGTVLFSPWLDLSLSYPDKRTLKRLSETTDFLTLSIGREWSDLAVFGSSVNSEEAEKMKKSHQISPFYGSVPILPHPMVIYSRHEVFGPSIEDFVIRLQKKQAVKVIAGEGLPHDYPLFGSFPSFGSMYQECKTVVEEVVKHLLEDLGLRSAL
jgi:acetyl esterase/lipase